MSPHGTMVPPPTKIAAIWPRAAITGTDESGGSNVPARASVREGLKTGTVQTCQSADHHLYKGRHIFIKGGILRQPQGPVIHDATVKLFP